MGQGSKTLTQLEILQKVSRQLPYTHTGQPRGYYRPDLIPPEVAQEDLESILDTAFVELSHSEGFPAFPDGRPFWHRMEQEPEGAFSVFQIFLESGKAGVRQLQDLLESPEALYHIKRTFSSRQSLNIQFSPEGRIEAPLVADQPEDHLSEESESPLDGTRDTLDDLETEEEDRGMYTPPAERSEPLVSLAIAGVPPSNLTSIEGQAFCLQTLRRWFFTYYWRERSRAHDYFKAAAYRHIRVKRAMASEDRHFLIAEKLLTKLEAAMEQPNFMADLTAKSFSEILKTLVAIQRVSTGLSSTGVGASSGRKDAEEQPQDFEMVLRQITSKSAKESPATIDEQGRVVPTADTLLRDVLNSSDATKLMQEVVIKITSPKAAQGTLNKARSSKDIVDIDEEGTSQVPGIDFDDEGSLRSDLGLS